MKDYLGNSGKPGQRLYEFEVWRQPRTRGAFGWQAGELRKEGFKRVWASGFKEAERLVYERTMTDRAIWTATFDRAGELIDSRP